MFTYYASDLTLRSARLAVPTALTNIFSITSLLQFTLHCENLGLKDYDSDLLSLPCSANQRIRSYV